MKRTIPLLITALGGFALIVAFFIPATQTWGERAAIWFDLLAAIAFVLGGGNLLKVHLKKISDQQAGWGYSAVTVGAFVITLVLGLFKVGVGPALNQEHPGESFSRLPLSALPTFSVPGDLPDQKVPDPLPASVQAQFAAEDGRLVFRGWIRRNQVEDLLNYDPRLAWRCAVEQLAAAATPPPELQGVLTYYFEHESLSFRGFMTAEQEAALRAVLPGPEAQRAIDELAAAARRETSRTVEAVPPNFRIPEDRQASLQLTGNELTVRGPMTPADRQQLSRSWAGFPVARRLDPSEQERLIAELAERGPPLNSDQMETVRRLTGSSWTASELRDVLNAAGQPSPQPKSACELLEEKRAGVEVLQPDVPGGEAAEINEAQMDLLEQFAADDALGLAELVDALRSAGPFTAGQEAALRKFVDELPTAGDRRRQLAIQLLKQGPLNREQIDFLLEEYRLEQAWRRDVARLFLAAHVPKYPWSGEYNQQGSAFWWIYEFVFQPLTATMFALLAFYVASAAFRAFRAKNLEAILLLGTALIILLGRTFAGVLLTAWLPESLSGLRIENLTIYIMSVFNTAGNRAIMIGIALGIASTSLKVLLGVDRSYMGSGED